MVVFTGWMGPTDGAEPQVKPCGTALWDESTLLAQVLETSGPSGIPATRPHLGAEAPPAAAVPQAPVPPLRRRAVRRGPIRLGLALPPMVCLVETCAPSDVLVEPPGASTTAQHCGLHRLLSLQSDLLPDAGRLWVTRDRYRLAPKGSPPA